MLRLNDLMLNLDRTFRRLIRTDIELMVLPYSDLKLLKADAGQLQISVINLIVNARDSLPRGSKVTISTSNIILSSEASAFHTDALW